MWMKLMAPAVTSMVSLTIATFSPQDGPKEKPVDSVNTEIRADDSFDSPDELSDLYDRLLKIRAKRLADRPKKLADEATELYRQAVRAVEKGEDDAGSKLTKRASELTHALEISLKTSREQPSDPDLPPPPRRGRSEVVIFRVKPQTAEIPPELRQKTPNGSLSESKRPTTSSAHTFTFTVPSDHAKVEASGDVRVQLSSPENSELKRDVIVRRRSKADNPHEAQVSELHNALASEVDSIVASASQKVQAETEQARAEAARAAVKAVHEDVIEKLNLKLRVLSDQKKKLLGDKIEVKVSDEMLDKLKKTESLAKLHEALAGMHGKTNQEMKIQILEKRDSDRDDAAGAIARLKDAHRIILDVRKLQKVEDGTGHLDAARDLYNSARREAEAKRFNHAAELAQAAATLAGLDQLHRGVLAEVRASDGKAGVKVLRDSTQEKGGKDDLLVKIAKPRRLDSATKVETPEADEAGPIQGIGVQLSFDEGKGEIQALIAGGPADQDGRIKPGDAIVGIETEGGATLGFADKSLVEVTKLLRGPVGSKVKLIVQTKGSSDRKVYEIERKTLTVPKPDAGAKSEGGGDDVLPPVLD